MTPGFGVMRSKVDEVKVNLNASGAGKLDTGGVEQAGGGAVRLPPGMRRGGNL